MKRLAFLAAALLILTGCGANGESSIMEDHVTSASQSEMTETSTAAIQLVNAETTEGSTELSTEIATAEEETETELQIEVNGYHLTADFADTAAAQELAALLKSEPMVLNLHEYGSFEKVGALPQSLPTDDAQITSEPGDIMLYLGNQITMFYGTNSWSYTPLGRIRDVSQTELEDVFGEGDVTVTLSLSD